ncbi:MAG: DUF58 domain-containing protein [Verrucomicrobia bacterium]|nr:DUF58 domain-containing protein [Verrucomicrobiota bacterium]
MTSPTNRLLLLALLWTLGGVVVVAYPDAGGKWWLAGAVLGAVALLDAAAVWLDRPISVSRRLPGRFAQGEPGEVRVSVRHDGWRAIPLEMFDGIPQGADAPAMPWSGNLEPGREARVFHPVSLRERGVKVFGPIHLRRGSPLGLWRVRSSHGGDDEVRVYPNYEPVVKMALLAMQHRDSPLGIVRRARAGTSRDFHQLRDYRDGDGFAQIDWKATSRRQKLISRDYQEQRNQTVVFLLDTGRRMRALDGDLPQFDHALNAILLVAHVALKQGDQVAVKSFGADDRWLPPVKGGHAMPVLLNHLYDYQTTASPSDFGGAVERLMARQRRRSLVVLLTNLRGEDGKELIPALQVLQSRHLVLLASLRERSVDETVRMPVDAFPHALRYLAADRYFSERREIMAELEALGISTLDTTAQSLAVALANRYLDIKAGGRL